MASPTSVTIRAYQVGFGDCFLLSFKYTPTKERHVLMDFGTMKLPPNAPKTRLRDVANDIALRTKGKLHAVIATHRHADHISGFATSADGKGAGDIIRKLKPDLVIQPWTENPKLSPAATGPKEQAFRFAQMHMAINSVATHTVAEATRLRRYIPKQLKDQLTFLGEDNISNPSAVKNLMSMGSKNVYAYCGADPELGSVLPGVKVTVLGPPTLKQSKMIKSQAHKHETEFWHFQARGMRLAKESQPGSPALFPRYVSSRGPTFPIDSRWLIYHLRRMRGEQLLQIVRSLDGVLNNTSLILLMEAGDKKLLFPGDAQIENWAYALNQPKYTSMLKAVNLYKVGHHGSLNATPKSLWELFQNRAKPSAERLQAIMSTLKGKHGREEAGTEVPRATLVSALKKDAHLHSTEDIPTGKFYFETSLTFRNPPSR